MERRTALGRAGPRRDGCAVGRLCRTERGLLDCGRRGLAARRRTRRCACPFPRTKCISAQFASRSCFTTRTIGIVRRRRSSTPIRAWSAEKGFNNIANHFIPDLHLRAARRRFQSQISDRTRSMDQRGAHTAISADAHRTVAVGRRRRRTWTTTGPPLSSRTLRLRRQSRISHDGSAETKPWPQAGRMLFRSDGFGLSRASRPLREQRQRTPPPGRLRLSRRAARHNRAIRLRVGLRSAFRFEAQRLRE